MSKKEKILGSISGLMIGDALGAQVEFKSISEIKNYFHTDNGFKLDLNDGGTFNLIKGQFTDDSEMALSLLHSLIENNGFVKDKVKKYYEKWLFESYPFDIGNTCYNAIAKNKINENSQSNGSLMRVTPLAIFYNNYSDEEIKKLTIEDCSITHNNKICSDCNAIFSIAIAHLINGENRNELFKFLLNYSLENNCSDIVYNTLKLSQYSKPNDFINNMGWVLIAFQNAFYQLLHANTFESAMESTIINGGDTDTNAAIAGSLYGSYCGINKIPESWTNTIKNCSPKYNIAGIEHPRPIWLWAKTMYYLISKIN